MNVFVLIPKKMEIEMMSGSKMVFRVLLTFSSWHTYTGSIILLFFNLCLDVVQKNNWKYL